jgi:hypothetical protein
MLVVTKMDYGDLTIDFEHKLFHPSAGATGAERCG